MRYNKIREMDISDGEGVRVSLFVQGCEFHCKGCFNPETWNFEGGKEFTTDTLNTLLELCDKEYIKGLSILGGEPMHPNNRETVVDIMRAFKYKFPNKDIWMWTGYTLEKLLSENDEKVINRIISLFYKFNTIQCTDCKYCESVCPKNIKLGDFFKLYNKIIFNPNDLESRSQYYKILKDK